MVRFLMAAGAALALLCGGANAQSAAAGVPGAAAGFTSSQRAEIVEILRGALKADPSILRDALTAMQSDNALRQEAAARAAISSAADALNRTPGDPIAGNPDAKVTVVEFYDVRCPYCRKMMPEEAEMLRANSDVKVIYKDIPILGPGSMIGARAVLAAQKQGGYAQLRTALMSGPPDVTTEGVMAAAQRLGLDWPRLAHDMEDASVTARIDANIALARQLDIEGTPAYIIGGKMIPGAVDMSELQNAIDTARRAN
jgi:protein-disulfide isomerase